MKLSELGQDDPNKPMKLSDVTKPEATTLPEVGRGRTAFDQSMQGATYGTADELQNMMGALIAHHVTGEDYHDLLHEATDNSNKRLEAETKQHPTLSGAAQLAGAIALPGAGEAKILGKVAPEAIAGSKVAANAVKGIVGGAAGGGAYGAGSSQDGQRISGARKGAELGAVTGGLVSGTSSQLAKLAAPKFDKAVKTLQNAGVKLTPGQMSYNSSTLLKRAEDALGHLPIIGNNVKNRLLDSFHSFNTAAFNKALAPIGKTMPKNIDQGRASVEHASDLISAEYTKLLPKINMTIDKKFAQDNAQLMQQEVSKLSPKMQKEFSRIIKNATDGRIPKNNVIPGVTYKKIESEVSQAQHDLLQSQAPQDKELGRTLGKYVNMVRDTIDRQNPHVVGELKKVDTSYAAFKRLQEASVRRVGTQGVFSPNDLLQAIKSESTDRQFATGNGLLQDLADAGSQVLPNTIPTIEQRAHPLEIAMEGTVAALHPHAAIPAALASNALYSKPVIGVARKLANTGKIGQATRTAIEKNSGGFGATLGTLMGKQKEQQLPEVNLPKADFIPTTD